jgi:outer membrane biogenesis lipoprotein LolB
MVTKCKIAVIFIALAVLAGCATTTVPQNQQEIYAEA